MRFQIGVGLERKQSTVVIVGVEAEDREEAERKAVKHVEELTRKPSVTAWDFDKSPGPGYLGWEDGAFSCLGVDRELDWGNGDYSSDLEVKEKVD